MFGKTLIFWKKMEKSENNEKNMEMLGKPLTLIPEKGGLLIRGGAVKRKMATTEVRIGIPEDT